MEIGFFQFDNLVRARVPFRLFLFEDFDFSFYQGPDQKHLTSVTTQIQNKKSDQIIFEEILEMELSHETPIVLICRNGLNSGLVAEMLAEEGYLNLFFVEGGYQQLIRRQ